MVWIACDLNTVHLIIWKPDTRVRIMSYLCNIGPDFEFTAGIWNPNGKIWNLDFLKIDPVFKRSGLLCEMAEKISLKLWTRRSLVVRQFLALRDALDAYCMQTVWIITGYGTKSSKKNINKQSTRTSGKHARVKHHWQL